MISFGWILRSYISRSEYEHHFHGFCYLLLCICLKFSSSQFYNSQSDSFFFFFFRVFGYCVETHLIFCRSILYPVTLLNSFISSNSFLMSLQDFLLIGYIETSSTNRDTFTSCFPTQLQLPNTGGEAHPIAQTLSSICGTSKSNLCVSSCQLFLHPQGPRTGLASASCTHLIYTSQG